MSELMESIRAASGALEILKLIIAYVISLADKFTAWLGRAVTMTPVRIDGYLYIGIAIFGAASVSFSSDEAYKYVEANLLYWLKLGCAIGLAACTALKTFRSTSYADHSRAVGTSDTTPAPANSKTPP